jgi:multimeric flavodoxin WrbA
LAEGNDKGGTMMKAVCILGSPKPKGSTSVIVDEIFRALKAYDIETHLYQLSDLNIGYCCGCKSCDITGKCVQTDDVQKMIGDIFASQLVIVASPSYWGDVTGQMKVFIDRCTPYCNTNSARLPISSSVKGVAVAVRAGGSKRENLNLVHTIEHFLGHLDIPLISYFTVEGISSEKDLLQRPDVLKDAYAFGENLFRLLG